MIMMGGHMMMMRGSFDSWVIVMFTHFPSYMIMMSFWFHMTSFEKIHVQKCSLILQYNIKFH